MVSIIECNYSNSIRVVKLKWENEQTSKAGFYYIIKDENECLLIFPFGLNNHMTEDDTISPRDLLSNICSQLSKT